MELFLSEVPYVSTSKRNDYLLFAESNSRFVVEVRKSDQKEFERILKGASFGLVGCLRDSSEFKIYGLDGRICLDASIVELKQAWQKPLRW